jgi:Fic family protein
MALKLNQRQLWFIGELQNGKHIGVNEIAKTWQKSYRTSKRDIQGLTKIGLVDRIGARKNGYYSLNQGVV